MNLSTQLARALIAYSVHEHQEGHVRRIDVWIRPGSLIVQDDGRGMGLDRAGYVDGLMGSLACRTDIVQLHGIALSLVATSTPSLHIESRRNGSLWTQRFAWGVPEAAPHCVGPTSETGTRIEMNVAHGEAEIEASAVIAQVDHWRRAHPALVFAMHG